MRVTLPHTLGKEEVRRRMKARAGDLAGYIPGGMAQVAVEWPDEDRMNLAITAMGQNVHGAVTVADTHLIVEVDLPPALGFFEPLIQNAVTDKGRKLLK